MSRKSHIPTSHNLRIMADLCRRIKRESDGARECMCAPRAGKHVGESLTAVQDVRMKPMTADVPVSQGNKEGSLAAYVLRGLCHSS